jgi:UrcA family protein
VVVESMVAAQHRSRKVKTNLIGIAVAAVCLWIGGIAAAQSVEELTVQGTRVLDTKNGEYAGVPVRDVSLSYGVNIADINLASQSGPFELEKRIRQAALAACEQLGRQFPQSSPSDGECTTAAVNKAMVKAHELVAAARKKLPQ